MASKLPSQYTTTVANSAQFVDMRSDTVTLPSDEMKQAMVNAMLGDDVYGEDETVNNLEATCAELFGKEAGLFVVSGTMGNLLAIMAHCQRGDEIIVGKHNHIHRWEQGNYAQLAGVSATTTDVDTEGKMKIEDIEEAIRVRDIHMPNTRLICLETTHNYSGGRALSMEYLKSVRVLASKYGINVHIDGARIYNASVALGVEVRDIAQYADSVMMCFSKGLGAPIGSILVGSRTFIDKARRSRKAVGGGWRQAGVLAAAANIALDKAEDTIKRDHANAKKLASGINAITPKELRHTIHAPDVGITNMVILKCSNGVSPAQVPEWGGIEQEVSSGAPDWVEEENENEVFRLVKAPGDNVTFSELWSSGSQMQTDGVITNRHSSRRKRKALKTNVYFRCPGGSSDLSSDSPSVASLSNPGSTGTSIDFIVLKEKRTSEPICLKEEYENEVNAFLYSCFGDHQIFRRQDPDVVACLVDMISYGESRTGSIKRDMLELTLLNYAHIPMQKSAILSDKF
ncbi:L-allo-threonine aldolase domain protein [Teladorsagia circumcincta]|uniref:L-allo-threonine aldolase domain protein n=1 Tax=Teladorsagia circumcincta TaxID=45464 RepID=A0A2G9UY11_TELCI|nr:L-allo-threonine aldolase domain protein [Teladorsagia circumcincta]